MGLEKINILEQVASLEVLSEELAKLQRTLRYLLNGNLDFQNIRVKGIQAENIDVDKLSAIVADIGEVTAGIMRGIAIYGSYIATSEDSYPRAEMSETEKMFKVAQSPTNYAEFLANYDSGGGSKIPALRFANGEDYMDVGGIGPGGVFGLLGYNDIYLLAYGRIYQFLTYFPNWGFIYNQDNGKSLQQELTEIRNSISTLATVVDGKADKV